MPRPKAYTDEDLYAAIEHAAVRVEGTLTTRAYEEFRKRSDEDLPSYATITNRLGSWRRVRYEALPDEYEDPSTVSTGGERVADGDAEAVRRVGELVDELTDAGFSFVYACDYVAVEYGEYGFEEWATIRDVAPIRVRQTVREVRASRSRTPGDADQNRDEGKGTALDEAIEELGL